MANSDALEAHPYLPDALVGSTGVGADALEVVGDGEDFAEPPPLGNGHGVGDGDVLAEDIGHHGFVVGVRFEAFSELVATLPAVAEGARQARRRAVCHSASLKAES